VKDTTEITRETYERIAPTYAQVSAIMSENLIAFANEFIELLEASFETGAHVLDVGCGPGRDMAWFEDQGITVIGVDYSQAMIEIAREKVRGALVRADMRHLPFEAGHMDGIWSNASLLHLPKVDARDALYEFKRVLKPGGILHLTVQEGEGEHLETRDVYGETERFFARYSSSEMIGMLEAAGFQTIEHREHPTPTQSWLRFLARAGE
jgi:ubiquinone/menaquinone biosynthesis C-methylase UbiE